MKDLKHMIFFEDLLQQSHNALVQQATDEGQLALGYNCYYIPEVLLNLKGCFSTRLRAPNSGTAEIASYYMTNRNCPYVRCILERAIEGGFNYLNALFGAEGCAAMERMEEHFALLHPVQNDRFFTTIIDPPMKGDKTSLDYYKAQLQLKVLDALHEHYGVDVSDEALREAVARHNRLCRVVTAIGDFRKLENPPITGYEYHVMMLVSQVCPHELILPYLEDTLAELQTRQPEPVFPFRARVALAGSEIDDPEFTKLIETCGAMVVADITYVNTGQGWAYLSLLTDASSRAIVGYALYKTLETEGPLKALEMAISFYEKYHIDMSTLIHHSDRGVQYCSNKYVERLKEHQINISMTQCGDPLHNALAERMNNTIKNGWLFDCDDESFEQVSKRIEDAVYVYNHVRPHQGINMRTPMEVVSETGGLTA